MVQASRPSWTDTTVAVRRGEKVRIVAHGRVSAHPGWGRAGPAGTNRYDIARSLLPWVPHAALLATIARRGEVIPLVHLTRYQPMVVGPDDSRTMPRTGELYLGINDRVSDDNRGEFTATITVAR